MGEWKVYESNGKKLKWALFAVPPRTLLCLRKSRGSGRLGYGLELYKNINCSDS